MAMVTKPLFPDSSCPFQGFHDQSSLFMSPVFPQSGDNVTIKIRVTAGRISGGVLLFTPDRPLGQPGKEDSYNEIVLTFSHTDKTGSQEFWLAVLPLEDKAVRYRFRLTAKEGGNYFVLPHGTFRHAPKNCSRDYLIQPGFCTPEWSHGTTYYSIMPDSFYNADLDSDTRNDFHSSAATFGMGRHLLHNWYGGDLPGIQKKFSYIYDYIGADNIYINPVWQAYSAAGYGAINLKMVNAQFASEAGLACFIDEAHKYGFHVLLDAVFAYYAGRNPFFNSSGYWPIPGAATDKASPYVDFFAFEDWSKPFCSWGQPVIDLDSETAREYVYTAEDSVVQGYLRKPYLADGWRFDVGNTLYGHRRNEHEILKDIRQYIKKANPDALFLSEHGSTDDMFDETLDSKWNYDFYRPLVEWAKGSITQTELASSLFEAVNRLPRPVALSVYNFLSNHDTPGIACLLGYDFKKVKAAQLLLMTYLGSPCIYYGDETGAKGTLNLNSEGFCRHGSNFDSMQWDRRHWNFEITMLYRSLCELRRAHKALRTGAFELLTADDSAKVFAYARYDEESTVIALITQNPQDLVFDLDVSRLGIADGEIFANWITGENIAVSNGRICVPLYCEDGGAVLIHGGMQSGRFRRRFELFCGPEGGIRYHGKKELRIPSANQISERKENLKMSLLRRFVGLEAENCGSLTSTANCPGETAGAIMMCDTLDGTGATYAAVLNSNQITVFASKSGEGLKEICSCPSGPSASLRLERKPGNQFAAYLKINNEWQLIENSRAHLDMDVRCFAGISALNGETSFSEPVWEPGTTVYGDRFSGPELEGIFFLRQAPDYKISAQGLRLAPGKMLLSPAPFMDFSVRTLILNPAEIEGAASWLTICLDENDAILLGRCFENGGFQTIFARLQNGTRQIYARIKDEGSPLYAQLQRVGTKISAFTSMDGKHWSEIFVPIHYNLSEPYAGLLAEGAEGCFGFFTYGDYINDTASLFNTPVCGINTKCLTENSSKASEGRFVIYSGSWDYAPGGFVQKSPAGFAAMGLEEKSLGDMYAELSIRREGGGGWAGMGFHLQDPATPESGYLLRLYSDNRLELAKGDTVLSCCKVPEELFCLNTLRLCVQWINGVVTVKAGLRSRVLFQLFNQKDTPGLCALYCQDCACTFQNFKFMQDTTDWSLFNGMGSNNVGFTGSGLMSWATLDRHAFTNVEISAVIGISKLSSPFPFEEEAGFHFSVMAKSNPVSGGLRVGFNAGEKVFIRSGETELASAEAKAILSQNRFNVRLENGVITIHLNNEPVLTYTYPYKNGWSFQLYSINSDCTFRELTIQPIF